MTKITDFRQIVESLLQRCSEVDRSWIQRSRKLNTLAVLRLLLHQVWVRNLGTKTAIALLINEGGFPSVTASAFSQARQRLHWRWIRYLFTHLAVFFPSFHPRFLWKERRIFAVDGSRLTLPHSFKAKKYKCPSRRSHYPQGLLSILYQLKLGVAHQAQLCRHLDERKALLGHLRSLQTGDILVLDRGFFL